LEVIAPVDEPTEWVNSLVMPEKKDGSLRLCLDPRDLNKAIMREHYKMPTAEDVASQLHGKKIFTILDETNGFWQVKLDKESSFLCTFNTPFGRYRFCRMPFGISSASEAFQKKNTQIFGDIPGVFIIVDDMIIASETEEEHDKILAEVMDRARKNNVKFNRDKIQYKVREVRYLGHFVTSDGLRPDKEKVEAIKRMPQPQCKQDLQRILGFVNYLSKFIPNMAEITAPLRALIRKDNVWEWNKEHEAALENIKSILTREPVLKFFDPTKKSVIQADASQHGLGACLLQEGNPIAYASRSLSATETNYAQIEKELLAIVFACTKFHQYIYGKNVMIQSDHKPLEAIIRKPLYKTSPRLQRMLLKLQNYQIRITYTPGKEMHIADTLSRAFLKDAESDKALEEEIELMIHEHTSKLSVSPERLQMLKTATKEDTEMQELMAVISKGWPQAKAKIPMSVRPYWKIRHHLYEVDGLIFQGSRLLIPKDLRREMLNTVHEGHLGIQKCKIQATEAMYWPGIGNDIENYISKCQTCNKFRKNQQKEPLKPHDIPQRPWQKLGMDIFQYGAQDYLLVVDYFSKYPEIGVLNDKTAKSVIVNLKSILARHRIPETIMSDNMPFASREFRQFAKSWDIELQTSSPTYPKSNGMSEHTIQTVKKLMRKATEANTDPYIALLEYRNSPIAGMSNSPAQLLMSRKLRTKIPVKDDTLIPTVIKTAHSDLKNRQDLQKKYHDANAKPLPSLQEGDSVRIRQKNTWEPALVTKVHNAPRSFIVTTEDGQNYRRNRQHLLKTAEPPPKIIGPEIEPDEHHLDKHSEMAAEVAQKNPLNKDPCATRSRSGRLVKLPSRFRDYDMC
jgi:hypothetical protein